MALLLKCTYSLADKPMKQLKSILIVFILVFTYQASLAQLAVGIGSLGFSGKDKQEVKLSGAMRIGIEFPLIQPIIVSESVGGFLVVKPGITWEKLHFEDNLIAVQGIRTSFIEDLDQSHQYKNNIFTCKTSMQSSSLNLPVEVYMPIHKKARILGSIGGFVNFKLDGKFKNRYYVDGEKQVDKTSFNLKENPYHINRWQYGVSASISYKAFTVYTKYHITPYFKHDKGPEIHMVEFGLFIRIR